MKKFRLSRQSKRIFNNSSPHEKEQIINCLYGSSDYVAYNIEKNFKYGYTEITIFEDINELDDFKEEL